MINKILKSNIKSAIFFGALCLSFITLIISCNPDETQTVAEFSNLVYQDNFNEDGAPDPNFWSYEIGNGEAQGIPGWGNNELEYYTDRPENVIVEDGVLKIRALREDFEGLPYTSGRILTKGKFEQKYGRFEARIQLPWGQGIWPAFWMLGVEESPEEVWPQIGEIDIMENRGQEPTLINGSVHGPGYSGADAITKAYELDNDRFDSGFHTFGVEWGENYINYYVDNELYNQITPDDVTGEWVYNDEFYIIFNLAVGGNYAGFPDDSTVFPQEMLIDYIRIYSAD